MPGTPSQRNQDSETHTSNDGSASPAMTGPAALGLQNASPQQQ